MKTSLHADQSGMVLIYVTLLLPVIVGFALLAVDVGRFTTLQSSLQHGSDALALAGAAELDRRPDAITRSESAMNTFITRNKALFTSSAADVGWDDVETCYLSALPASDATPIDPATCLPRGTAAEIETSSIAARFVQVIVDPKNYDTIFPASFIGALSNTTSTSAEAVAGFQAAVCDFTTMFICNPYEESGNTNITEATELMKHFNRENGRLGRLINMKQTGGNNAQYFPGNFGFLIPAGTSANPGADTLRDNVAVVSPKACFLASGVELRTGAITAIRTGFNVRFDLYEGKLNGKKSHTDYRPAKNVRKGVWNDGGKGSACNPDDGNGVDDPNFSKLSRDTCFASSSCPYMGGRMGDGSWDRATYWKRAHNQASWPSDLPSDATRYEVYQYELKSEATLVKNDSNGAPNGGEYGNPRCWNGDQSKLSNTPDRRIFHAAILNCQALNASSAYGPIKGGSSNKLPVVAFAKFFITEPVQSANAANNGKDPDRKSDETVADGDVWAEMVGIDQPGSADNVARDIVQLYR
ncbi:pilus assembly protein TadG-related protein [Aestuariivirga sp.]|uniref:pilus assembly protein TadG-related protein n=1 Tax=Aestuariivirga sp. TaxID=2650926 RepID=UPI00391C1CEC